MLGCEALREDMDGEGVCLQGIKGDCGANGNDINDDTDGRCYQDGIDRNAESRMHLREGVRERVTTVACECPGSHVSRRLSTSVKRSTYHVRRETEARMLNCEQPMTK